MVAVWAVWSDGLAWASLPGRESGGVDSHGTALARCLQWP